MGWAVGEVGFLGRVVGFIFAGEGFMFSGVGELLGLVEGSFV